MDDAKRIDQKLRELLENKTKNYLPICLFLGEINRNIVYKKLGYESMKGYMVQLSQEKGIKFSKIKKLNHFGYIYLKYEKDLKKAGFKEEHGLSKLQLLKRALDSHEKDEVYRYLLSLPYKDFYKYINNVHPNFFANLNNNKVKKDKPANGTFTLNGKTAVTINQEIDKELYSYLVRVCQHAFRAIRRGEKIYYMRVKNREEFDRFESAFKKLIRQLRKKS